MITALSDHTGDDMTDSDLKRLLPDVLALSREAGRAIMEVYAQDFSVQRKADRSPVTEADLRADAIIQRGLRSLTPHLPIVSEESAATRERNESGWPEWWLVDPLDGTGEFIARQPAFTVNIALIRGGQPVLGVVHVPAQQLDFFAARGVGAFRQPLDQPAAAIHVGIPRSPPRVLASRLHRDARVDRFLERLGEHHLLSVGSSLKFCLVAEGGADVYPRFSPTCEWDTAAGQAVLECAGGRVVDLNGQPLRYRGGDSLLNPHFIASGSPGRDWLACL